jgi:hypothetical protein
MKRTIISMAIILAIILTTLSLQGCFTPYPERGENDRVGPTDRGRGGDMWKDMGYPWP